jgi:hypothetical protein
VSSRQRISRSTSGASTAVGGVVEQSQHPGDRVEQPVAADRDGGQRRPRAMAAKRNVVRYLILQHAWAR